MNRHIVGLLLATSVAFVPATWSGQSSGVHLLDMSVDTDAGYDSNRFRDVREDGSAFFEVRPRLTYLWMSMREGEVALYASGLDRQFLASGLSADDELEVGGRLLARVGRTQVAARFAAGRFRNGDYAWDDHDWLALSPEVRRGFAERWEWNVRGLAAYETYGTRTTAEGAGEDAVYGLIAPGLSCRVGAACRVWVEVLGEGYQPNEPLDEYVGIGARGGATWRVGKKLKVGAELEAGRRQYHDLWDSRKSTLRGQLWTEYRIRTWVDLRSSAEVITCEGSVDAFDYDRWLISAGLRFTTEMELYATR